MKLQEMQKGTMFVTLPIQILRAKEYNYNFILKDK